MVSIMAERQIRYYKPNVGALSGKIGKSILETIKNTPRPDRTKLKTESDKVMKEARKEAIRCQSNT